MKKSEFVKKVTNDLRIEHLKRLKMWQECHTDKEIAFVCKTTVKTIEKWRKKHNLSERVCLTVARRKDPSWLRKGMGNKITLRGCM